ncbi:MAG: hypothetical protein LC802_02795 [Acidobacteria bacterium]|nr:hypothetical protein [Acidobacteriota bacterium]
MLALEGNLGEFLGVEEIGRAQVRVAALDAGVDARRLDDDVDRRFAPSAGRKERRRTESATARCFLFMDISFRGILRSRGPRAAKKDAAMINPPGPADKHLTASESFAFFFFKAYGWMRPKFPSLRL